MVPKPKRQELQRFDDDVQDQRKKRGSQNCIQHGVSLLAFQPHVRAYRHSGNGPALKAYPISDSRAEELAIWLHRDNSHRPHGGLNSQTPISKPGLKNNLLRLRI
jgi:hypothetical protein